MKKEEYYESLKSPEWIEKRDYIKKRDNYCCTNCNSKKELQVHHTYYIKGKMPWEVPDDCLVTLCRTCHEREHDGVHISSFIRKNTVEAKKNQKKRKKVNKRSKLSKEERALQEKYDKLKRENKLPKSSYTQPKFKKPTKKDKKRKK